MIPPILSPYRGRFWRMLAIRYQGDPNSGEGARLLGGRWNRRGRPALYLSADPPTAIAEYHQDLVRPGTLVACDVVSAAIADLVEDAAATAALAAEWETAAPSSAILPPGWAIAERLIAAGADGALVPSAQHRGGVNLVLWRWHDAAAGAGDGAALRWIDPERDLAR